VGKREKGTVVNTKVIYAATGGIAAAAIAIFFIMGMGNFRFPGSSDNTPGAAQTQQADLQLGLKDIVVNKTDDENANVQVVFDVHNPNRSTALLETVHYTLHVGQYQMTTGDIGVSPEGFVAGQESTFPIVGNTTVTLKDTQVAARNNLTASSWDSMVDGTAQYRVEGSYSYRLTGSNFQTSYYEKEFTLTFP
jgi:NADPH:quinone reductase-like Zn-dependent oxidoreductase